jgi:hypothetical protein
MGRRRKRTRPDYDYGRLSAAGALSSRGHIDSHLQIKTSAVFFSKFAQKSVSEQIRMAPVAPVTKGKRGDPPKSLILRLFVFVVADNS